MALQAEIQSREQSLAALMTRILQEPLRPIEQSIQNLGKELTDAQERLQVLDDLLALTVSLEADVTKTASHAKKVVNESVPDLKAHLTEHVSAASKDHRQAIESAIAGHADRSALTLHEISQALSAGLTEAAARHAVTSASIDRACVELSESIKEAGSGFQGALVKLLQQLRSLHSLSESHHAALVLERETADRAVENRFEELVALCTSATREQHAAFHQQMNSYRQRVGQLTVVTGLLLAGVMGLAGLIVFQMLGRAG